MYLLKNQLFQKVIITSNRKQKRPTEKTEQSEHTTRRNPHQTHSLKRALPRSKFIPFLEKLRDEPTPTVQSVLRMFLLKINADYNFRGFNFQRFFVFVLSLLFILNIYVL